MLEAMRNYAFYAWQCSLSPCMLLTAQLMPPLALGEASTQHLRKLISCNGEMAMLALLLYFLMSFLQVPMQTFCLPSIIFTADRR
jgi:hypothetical protein